MTSQIGSLFGAFDELRSLTVIVLMLPFVAAALAPLVHRALGDRAALVLALAPLGAFLHFACQLPVIDAGRTIADGYPWVPSLGLSLSWYLDGLSLTFALLISGIGTLIILYSGAYLKGDKRLGRFYAYMFLFMGSMQGLVIADSFLMLFIFWELTSITSFLLIGFDSDRMPARRAALQALIVTGAGGLALLAGLLLVAQATGQNQFSTLMAEPALLRDSPLYLATFVLIAIAAFTKSAQVPTHVWLPNAMQAPTPVSAYLHSATMVKAGVYLLMRLFPVMGGTALWHTVLPVFGGATLLVGALLSLRETDLKLMLAYSTVASLGLLVLLIGVGSEAAIAAAVLYLVAHALFKGALFMVAGILDHQTGTRDVARLGGLARSMPLSFAAALLAALSMGGLPLFFGFLAKEEVYAALDFGGGWLSLLSVVALAGNALLFVVAIAAGLLPFIGVERPTPKPAADGSLLLVAGPLTLAAVGLIAAFAAPLTHRLISSPAASAVAGTAVPVDISIVPHLGLPLLMSGLTIAAGTLLAFSLPALRQRVDDALGLVGWGPDRGFDQAVRGLLIAAHRLTGLIQNGRLDRYVATIFVVLAAALLLPLAVFGEWPAAPSFPHLLPHEWLVLLIAVIGIGAVLWAKDRLVAIVSLGIQGLAVALIYLLLGAPDLAFTQFMVETLSVVILALVMTRLKLTAAPRRRSASRVFGAVVALAGGTGFALVLMKITEQPFDDTLTAFFNANAVAIAHGRNIVNVIIVDFRGLDTLGEIAVVMVAGLAILALIGGRPAVGAAAPRASDPGP